MVGGLDSSGGSVDDAVEERSGRGREDLAPNADVNVQIGNVGNAHPREVLLNPFGRSDKTILFTIPAGKDNGAQGLPAKLQSFAEGTDNLVENGRSAVGVTSSARNPSITVVADN